MDKVFVLVDHYENDGEEYGCYMSDSKAIGVFSTLKKASDVLKTSSAEALVCHYKSDVIEKIYRDTMLDETTRVIDLIFSKDYFGLHHLIQIEEMSINELRKSE